MEVICNKTSQNCNRCPHSVPHYDKPSCKSHCSTNDDTKCISVKIYQRKLKIKKLNENRR